MASSCYFLASHTMRVGNFSRFQQADFRSPNHALVTNDSTGFPYNTACTITLSSDYSLTGRQRFMITTFCKPLGLLYFPHEEARDWTPIPVQRDKLYTDVIVTYDPSTNQSLNSVRHANFGGFSAFC